MLSLQDYKKNRTVWSLYLETQFRKYNRNPNFNTSKCIIERCMKNVLLKIIVDFFCAMFEQCFTTVISLSGIVGQCCCKYSQINEIYCCCRAVVFLCLRINDTNCCHTTDLLLEQYSCFGDVYFHSHQTVPFVINKV